MVKYILLNQLPGTQIKGSANAIDTTYVLHVTIHGENETRSAVGPKQGDECAKTYLTIQDDFVHVTIQNKIRLGYDLSRMLCLSYLKIYMIPFSPLELWFSKP